MATKPAAVVEEEQQDDYWQHRFHQARRAGLTRAEANRFADGDVPLAQLRKLVAGGAKAEVIARVVT